MCVVIESVVSPWWNCIDLQVDTDVSEVSPVSISRNGVTSTLYTLAGSSSEVFCTHVPDNPVLHVPQATMVCIIIAQGSQIIRPTCYLLIPWCRVLLEKLTGLQLVKKFTAFHGTRRFITALTNVRHLSLSWARPIQSIYPHPTSWRSILILSTHLRLGFPSGLFPSGFPTKTLYTSLSSAIRATCPAHLILLHFITRTILGEEYKSLSSSLCSLLHSPLPRPSSVQIFSSNHVLKHPQLPFLPQCQRGGRG